MRNRGLRTGLTLLLSAALLLGALTPPAIQHAHAAGDRLHDHHDGAADARHGGHEHHHDKHHWHPHAQRPKSSDPSGIAYGVTPHRHLLLLGFEFYLPPGENVPSNGDDDHRRTTLVRPVDSDAVLASGSVAERLYTCLPSPATVASNPAAGPRRQGAREDLSSPPLWDGARGERSGVQLI